MPATVTKYLSQVRQGDIFVYNIISQAMYTGTIILKDNSEIYFTVQKTNRSVSPTLLG
jgi:hypothetical protein